MYLLYCCSFCDSRSDNETEAKKCEAQGRPERLFNKGQELEVIDDGQRKLMIITRSGQLCERTHEPIYVARIGEWEEKERKESKIKRMLAPKSVLTQELKDWLESCIETVGSRTYNDHIFILECPSITRNEEIELGQLFRSKGGQNLAFEVPKNNKIFVHFHF